MSSKDPKGRRKGKGKGSGAVEDYQGPSSDNLNAAIWGWGMAEGNGVGNYAEKSTFASHSHGSAQITQSGPIQCAPSPSMDPQKRSSTNPWLSRSVNVQQMGQQTGQQASQQQRQDANFYPHSSGSILQSNIGYGSAAQSQSPGTSYTGPTPQQQAIYRPAIQSQTTGSYTSSYPGIAPQRPSSRGSSNRAKHNRKDK